MHSHVRSLWTFIYLSIYSYLFALQPFEFSYMEMKIIENTFPPYEDLHAFHFPHHPSLTPPLVMSNAETVAWSLQH
jgi:hypothetical protein